MSNETTTTTTGKWEAVAVALVVAGVVAALFGEYILIAGVVIIGAGVVGAALWGGVGLVAWAWRFVGDTRLGWDERRQNMAIQAAKTKQMLMLADKQSEVLYPVDGFMPIAHNAVIDGSHNMHLLELNARRIETLAPVANVPHSMTYAPHISQKHEGVALPDNQKAFDLAPVGDFFSLFSNGKLPKDKFLVGTSLEDGSDITATWGNLYSALIGGMSGSGKSTLIRSLLAQSALQGGRFVVIDPHYGAGEESLGASLQPLRNLMLCDVASNDREMSSALKYVADIGKRRLSGQDTDKTPIVLVCDETTGLLQRGNIAEQLIDVLGMISQETRKVGLYAFCIGQNFSGQVLPTEVRNSFVSFISCRARRDVARTQSGSSEFGRFAEHLTTGQAVWMTPSGDVHRVAVPNCTQSHLQHVAQSLTVNANENLMSCPMTQPMIGDSNSGQAAQDFMSEVISEVMSAEEQRIRELFIGGASVGDIAVEVFGVSKKAGQPYVNACGTVQAAIRKCMS